MLDDLAIHCGVVPDEEFQGNIVIEAIVLFRNIFILQAVRLVLTYNFTDCDFNMILKIYRVTVFRDLEEDLKGSQLDQLESCDSLSVFYFWRFLCSLNSAACEQTDCLMKIEHRTFNPGPGCPSLPEKAFASGTKELLLTYCPGYSEIKRNNTQEMEQEVKDCLNQTTQILGLWVDFIQTPR
ncbi:thymic stromal lymphopoietin [Acomys russatus]|uniref:thymic stromal lymphopoietin n=1 Tax=Acomys russatus TaxID=60746 RepID=UPI0021E305F9|nr:thymic stromal lymphopoietin [Acomys russatus]